MFATTLVVCSVLFGVGALVRATRRRNAIIEQLHSEVQVMQLAKDQALRLVALHDANQTAMMVTPSRSAAVLAVLRAHASEDTRYTASFPYGGLSESPAPPPSFAFC